MKNLFVLLFIVIGTLTATAQYSSKAKETYASRYGIKISGGAIVTRPEITLIGNEQDYVVHQVELANSSPQFSAGLWGQKRFGWLYAEANVLYSSYGMSYDVSSYNADGQTLQNLTERFSYVDLQVMGGLISHGFRIGVGPVMHVLANHSSELEGIQNYNQKLRNISYGFSGAIGYDLGRFSFDLKYDKAFRTVGDHIYYGYKKSQFLETPDAISLAIAYAIF